MKLPLPRFGLDDVEIDPKTLIELPNGLPGFEDCKHFKLFHSGDNPLVFWLQSIDDASVVFSLAAPESLHVLYEMTLADEELEVLNYEAGDDLQIAVILARQEESFISVHSPIVANYTSPIVINVSKQIAMQKTLQDSEFSFHAHQALPEAPKVSIQADHGFPEALRSRTRAAITDDSCALAL